MATGTALIDTAPISHSADEVTVLLMVTDAAPAAVVEAPSSVALVCLPLLRLTATNSESRCATGPMLHVNYHIAGRAGCNDRHRRTCAGVARKGARRCRLVNAVESYAPAAAAVVAPKLTTMLAVPTVGLTRLQISAIVIAGRTAHFRQSRPAIGDARNGCAKTVNRDLNKHGTIGASRNRVRPCQAGGRRLSWSMCQYH